MTRALKAVLVKSVQSIAPIAGPESIVSGCKTLVDMVEPAIMIGGADCVHKQLC